MDILKELSWRGLLKQCTNEEKIQKAQFNHSGVYCGFDPTGDSLHVGHLIQILLLERFNRAGFAPIAIIGGGTGMIGDPSGKKAERVLLNDAQVQSNVQALKNQLTRLIPNVAITNNRDWLGQFSLIDFLRDVGKHFNISYLLAKENIATRISTGLSYTEFSYTLLQALDFCHLYQNNNCHVQIGGSDQWGNITSGIDYISKIVGSENLACGITMHLLTKADGTKFGKTESGAVWLDPNKTSPYAFYQFFFNQSDEETKKLLRFMTFYSQSEIEALELEHANAPQKRLMQSALANAITEFVHGSAGLNDALEITKALFSGEVEHLSAEQLMMLETGMPTFTVDSDWNLGTILTETKIASSKREVREFLAQKAISVNNHKPVDENVVYDATQALHNKYLVLRKGKRNYYLIILNTK